MPSIHRPWTKSQSTTDHSSSSQPTSMPKVESPTSEGGVNAMPQPTLIPGVPPTNLAIVPPPEGKPAISPISDKLAEAWDAVKDGPKVASTSRGLDAVGDAVAAAQSDATPFIPVIKAAIAVAEQTDFGKVMKDKIDKFSEGIPLLISALDELKTLHPFIGVVVMAFKTAYTLQQKRRDNDQKVISLFVEMKDIMGVLLLLKDVKNDELTAPNNISIKDRLTSLVERTADDIKVCSNVCDAYMKKRPLAKVILSSVWDVKLLDFTKLFTERRQKFQFEITIHTSQGVNKANTKLDAIEDETRELNRQMNEMKALFQQLVSSEQKQLSELVAKKGGVKALRGNERAFIDLEKAASNASGQAGAEGLRTRQEKLGDADPEIDNLRNEIFEDPNAAADNNWKVFSRKFDAQRNQIIDKLTLVVQRESDRVIREVQGSAHERIRDRSIHGIWVEMGWRGHVKARHFVLALRDYYLEKLSDSEGIVDLGASSNPDAWAIKFIDVMWVQPILEAFDDDASGFITISEVNTFTSTRPVNWSLPHWLAFWAVGFKWSIIDYAQKIENLFAKMDGVRTTLLPPNRKLVDRYFGVVWEIVHTLATAALSLDSVLADSRKFKLYLEAEETRLETNLRAVNYVIDGIDTLTLITGGGRIEKTVFPLLYLLMKRHYEMMRIMRTKVVDHRDPDEAVGSIYCVHDAIVYRMGDLASNFRQQRLDPEKQFESFAYGIFKHLRNLDALWTVDYIRNIDSEVISYDDDNEDQNVQPGDVLNGEYKDELSLDNWVYDGHSIDDIPDYRDVGPPLKDILGHWHGYLYDNEGVRATGVRSMMTFVLVPGNGEEDIKAEAWSLQARSSITWSWSKGENGTIQITLKISFDSYASPGPVFFTGHFDAERDALTGVWGDEAELENAINMMEFRRIPPHYLTIYPDMKELSGNKPRALWRFAIAAVRNDIRRDHWSWSYFSQRRSDRESVVPLLIRLLYFGPNLSDEEMRTFNAIRQRLTPADGCFYYSKVKYISANTRTHWTDCCSCGGLIGGARLFCLDCIIEDKGVFCTVDLCAEPPCLGAGARITNREGLESPHEPTHRLVKARSTVVPRNYGRVHRRACEAFERVSEFCLNVAESLSHSHDQTGTDDQTTSSIEPASTETAVRNDKPVDFHTAPDLTEGGAEVKDETATDAAQDGGQDQDQNLPTCGRCKGGLSFPFWYCIFCEDDLFICNACDAEGVPDLERSSGNHTEEHHLIRCLAPEKEDDQVSPTPTEQRLTSIEGRLDDMQTKMQTQLDDLSARIGNIEQLLHKLTGALERVA